jgi:hypothetical protein
VVEGLSNPPPQTTTAATGWRCCGVGEGAFRSFVQKAAIANAAKKKGCAETHPFSAQIVIVDYSLKTKTFF